MGHLLQFILVFIFLVAGISQVPACYATKPDCDSKATMTCPMATSGSIAASDNNMDCCMLERSVVQESSPVSFPLDRLKRLKIEQIQHDLTILPPFVPGLISTLMVGQGDPRFPDTLSALTIDKLHYRPPPLFIQNQSFLI
jgi:hypothetical protein